MFSTLGSAKTYNPRTIIIDTNDLKHHLPYHVEFQIVVAHLTKSFTQNIFRTVVDEGTPTYVMSLACWRDIGQLFCLHHLCFLLLSMFIL
jgi:hypothetical protein